MSELLVENNLSNKLDNGEKQRNFLHTSIGKAINTGLNIGLRYILPDLIEDQVIEIKDSFIQNGFREGVKTAIDSAINFGKSALGIITGNFESVQQMQDVIKKGGLIDSLSNVINYTINKTVEKGKIPYNIGNTIKKSKNIILNNITKNIENEFENQVNNIEKLNKYTEQWQEYFDNKDFEGMEREYNKINEKMKVIAPIEKVIQNVKIVENLHKLIKNNGKNFDLSSEEIELASII